MLSINSIKKMGTAAIINRLVNKHGFEKSDFEDVSRSNLIALLEEEELEAEDGEENVQPQVSVDVNEEEIEEAISELSSRTPFETMMANAKKVDSVVSYATATFPIKHIGDGVFDFGGFEAPLSRDGAGYIYQKLRPVFKSSAVLGHFDDGDWDWFEEVITRYERKLDGEYTAALFDGEVVGIMKNYNPVNHESLANIVKEAGLENEISYSYFSQRKFSFGISIGSKTSDATESEILVSLHIDNGHSGHHALRYSMLIRVDDYEYNYRLDNIRRRHLSKVHEARESLEGALEEARETKLFDRLEAMTASEAMNIVEANLPERLTIRQEQILEALRKDRTMKTGTDVVSTLTWYTNQKGNKSAVKRLCDPILEKALS